MWSIHCNAEQSIHCNAEQSIYSTTPECLLTISLHLPLFLIPSHTSCVSKDAQHKTEQNPYKLNITKLTEM